jgi:hypothetical protein
LESPTPSLLPQPSAPLACGRTAPARFCKRQPRAVAPRAIRVTCAVHPANQSPHPDGDEDVVPDDDPGCRPLRTAGGAMMLRRRRPSLPAHVLPRSPVPPHPRSPPPTSALAEPVPEVEARRRRKPQLRPARLRRSQIGGVEAASAQGVQQAAGCRRVLTLATAICHNCQALLWLRGMPQKATGAATAPATGSV